MEYLLRVKMIQGVMGYLLLCLLYFKRYDTPISYDKSSTPCSFFGLHIGHPRCHLSEVDMNNSEPGTRGPWYHSLCSGTFTNFRASALCLHNGPDLPCLRRGSGSQLLLGLFEF
jgi:hypothetical protein